MAGWRSVFAVAAVSMLVLAAALWRALPQVPPSDDTKYLQLLAFAGARRVAEAAQSSSAS